MKKPRIRHFPVETVVGRITWVVDFPGDVFPWPCLTWQDALDAVERWYRDREAT